MKANPILLLLCCFFGISTMELLAQDAVTDPYEDLVPPSPEAAALAKEAELSIAQYTGAANINIPLSSINGDNVSLPISISYSSNGVKVDEFASRIGLGWTLKAGGVISRIKRGKFADEYMGTYEIGDDTQGGGGTQECKAGYRWSGTPNLPVDEAWNDYEPDIFIYNFGGYSGKFVIEKGANGVVHTINKNNLKIEYEHASADVYPCTSNLGSIIKFTITSPDGVQYEFADVEYTEEISTPPAGLFNWSGYNSAYYLSTVTDLKTDEKINLIYDVIPSGHFVFSESEIGGAPGEANPENCSCGAIRNGVTISETHIHNLRVLKSIESKHDKIVVTAANRSDIADDKRYTQLKKYVKNPNTSNWVYQRTWQFVQSYFIDTENNNGRLKLDRIKQTGYDGSALPDYTFNYDLTTLPPRCSPEQDAWGFYNANGATSSLPQLYFYPEFEDGEAYTFFALESQGPNYHLISGAQKTSNESACKGGILTSVVYPTGAVEELTYELNRFNYRDEIIQGGGLRVKTKSVNTGSAVHLVHYDYTDPVTEESSGYLPLLPQFAHVCREPEDLTRPKDFTVRYSSAQSRVGGLSSNMVGYDVVQKIFPDNGKIVNYYTSVLDYPDVEPMLVAPQIEYLENCTDFDHVGKYDKYPFSSITSMEHRRSLIEKTEVLTESGALIEETEVVYDFILHGEIESVYSNTLDPLNLTDVRIVTGFASISTIYSEEIRKNSTTKRSYDQNGGNFIEATTSYTYDPEYFNVLSVTKTAPGGSNTTTYTYANQLGRSDMMAKHMVSVPLEYKTTGIKTSGIKIDYADLNTDACIDCLLPVKVYAFNSEINNFELSSEVVHFNADGLPTQVDRRQNTGLETYTWNKSMLVNFSYLDRSQAITYDGRRRMKSLKGIDDQTSDFTYDGFNRLLTTTARGGNVSTNNTYHYGNGTGTNLVFSRPSFKEGDYDLSTVMVYDALGRETVKVVAGHLTGSTGYDAMGRVITKEEPSAYGATITEYEQSPGSRALKSGFDGWPRHLSSSHQIVTLNGIKVFKTTTINENGHVSESYSDYFGRNLAIWQYLDDGSIAKTTYKYDNKSGAVSSVTPPGNGPRFSYQYDGRNRVISKSIPDYGVVNYSYCAGGGSCYGAKDLVLSEIHPNVEIGYEYTAYDEVKTVSHDGEAVKSFTYYNSNSNGGKKGLVKSESSKILEGIGSIDKSYTYDGFGRLVSEEVSYPDGTDDSFGYIYDDADQVLVLTRGHSPGNGGDNVGIREEFEYDEYARQSQHRISLNGGPTTVLSSQDYAAKDKINSMQFVKQDGQGGYLYTVDYGYNSRGWMTNINDPSGTQSVDDCNGSDLAEIVVCVPPENPTADPCDLESIWRLTLRLMMDPNSGVFQFCQAHPYIYTVSSWPQGGGDNTPHPEVTLTGAGNLDNFEGSTNLVPILDLDTDFMDIPTSPDGHLDVTIEELIGIFLISINNYVIEVYGVDLEGCSKIWPGFEDKLASTLYQLLEPCFNDNGNNIQTDPPLLNKPSDIFGMTLSYLAASPTNGSIPQYNGNVAQMTSSAGGWAPINFGFCYDALDRMISANDGSGRYSVPLVNYDLRGNILSLERYGVVDYCGAFPKYGQIDDLVYLLSSTSNQINMITDHADLDHGFAPEDKINGEAAFTAGNAGNIINDGKSGSVIQYNTLNIPSGVDNALASATMTYDADGSPYSTEVTAPGEPGEDRKYYAGIEYNHGQLESIQFPGGRIVKTEKGWRYEVFVTDHLGNTRVVISDLDGSGSIERENEDGRDEILSIHNYYPFGMEMTGPWQINNGEMEARTNINTIMKERFSLQKK